MSVEKSKEKTVLKVLGFCASTCSGNPCAVDVKDGKITRIRPLHYDSKYTREEINPWKVQRNGKTFEPPMKSLPGPFSLAPR